MIPVSLSIEGLYSYREKQVVDFEKLTSGGLFGIFGEVGSGKSSILEAIMFILFDDTERLNKRDDNRYYNMLNLQSNQFCIDFTFLAGSGSKEKYRFTCTAKRNSKNFEDVKINKNDRNYYKWDNEQWIPLEDVKDATEILGMDYKNFKQTIIIPQGKFREFVDQTSGDRTKMLKELFQLHHFDLGPQTGRLTKDTEMQIQNLQGQMETLGEASKEKIKELAAEAEKLGKELTAIQSELEGKRKVEQQLQQLKQLYEEIVETKEALQNMERDKDAWQLRSERLRAYQRAYTHFYELFKQQAENTHELKEKKKLTEDLEAELKQLQEVLEKIEAEHAKAKSMYDKRDEIKEKCDDLERILKIKQLEVSLEKKAKDYEKVYDECCRAEEEHKKVLETIRQQEERLQKLEEAQPDVAVLSDVYQWLSKKDDLRVLVKKEESSLTEIQETLDATKTARTEVLNGFEFLKKEKDWEGLFNALLKKKEELEKEEKEYQEQLNQLLVQQKIAEFADNLKSGEPCLLCGATEHPAPVKAAHASEALEKHKEKLHHIKKLKLELHEVGLNLTEIQADYKNLANNLQKQQEQIKAYQQQILAHEQAFSWPGYEKTEITVIKMKLEEARRSQQKLQQTRQEIRGVKLDQEKKAEALEKQKQNCQALEKEKDKLETEINTLKNNLNQQNQAWLSHDIYKIEDSLQKGRKVYHNITKEYEAKQQELQVVQQKISQKKGRQEAEIKAITALLKKVQQQDTEIHRLCQEKGFTSPEHVKGILQQRLDIDKEQQLIEQFQKNLHSTRENLMRLEKLADGKRYHEQQHLELKQVIKQAEERCEEVKEMKITREQEKVQMEHRLQKGAALQKELDRLQLRLMNLKELGGLFRGSGFVDYVSTIYLQDLCRAANERFFRLTRNNLSLELNEQNNFIVRDYLNGGKTRLLKTLSGGQTFQAALCLALAMAENIKSLNKADQSFFFLDEGFGSLDKESLRVVFDTLKSLRKENRIVGVISHVEELQQEIDIFLKITNDKEKGSLISCSWEG